MEIEQRALTSIVPYAKNARKIPKTAVDKVAASIREFGWRQPIVVDPEGVIIVGHTRRLAAMSLGLADAPVHVARNLTPTQVRAYRLMDNRSNEEAAWDRQMLGMEIGELKGLDIDLALTGFDPIEFEKLLPPGARAGEDHVPAAEAMRTSRPGDLWLLGAHRVICGSSSDAEIVARLLGDRGPSLMVTDPPYGIELDSEWRDRAGINSHWPAQASYMKHRIEGHENTTISGDTRADWSEAFALVPSLQVAYVWHASAFTREVLEGLLRIGFLHSQQIIWDKGIAAMTRTHYWYQHEPCWYVRKKNAPWYGVPGKGNTTIWAAASPKMIMANSKEEKFDHPTQKPVELMRKSILNHTRPGELVYEPFLGSGTTLAAAEVTERVCCGAEIDPKFVDVIVRRWEKLAGAKARLDGDGRTFDEILDARAAEVAA